MKKIFYLLITGLLSTCFYAQETTVEDALRLAIENTTGTARFRSMSGAFGAVGGDLSAINQNPAGSIFFANNYATGTLSNYYSYNSSLYFGTKSTQSDNSLDINQVGVVFVFNNEDEKADWKKMALAINYENNNNYSNSIFSRGTNPYNSIGNYFTNMAQGIPLEYLTNYDYGSLYFNEQQAYLGYDTYIFEAINPNDNNNVDYYTNIPTGGNYYQENLVYTTGYNSKVALNFSTLYKNKLSLGANLNFHFMNIEKIFSVKESNDNPIYDTGSTIQSITFENDLITSGGGFSFNLGAIYKPTENVRLGLAYESPTWFRLTDQLTQGVTTRSINNPDNNSNPSSYQNTIVYEPYFIQTPSKITGSLALIFGKTGLLSADVSTKDYSVTRFKPKSDPSYIGLNNFMSNNLEQAIEVRIGGEYKIKQFSVRGGYHFDQSPYKVDQTFGDLTGYTGGIGYNFGENRIDIAYTHEYRNMNQAFLSSGMTDPARINRKNNNITISYSVNF